MTVSRRFVAWAGTGLINALMRTTRYDVQGAEHFRQLMDGGTPVIFVLWHSRLLPLSYSQRALGLTTMISASADGEHIARVVRGWGYDVVRGSSSRNGGAALRALVRCARAGRSIAITPDGPRGPREKIKPGAVILAQMTGMPLIPAAAFTQRAWWANSWDRFLVPKPFAHVYTAYGPAIKVPREATRDELDALTLEIENVLKQLHADVERAATAAALATRA